MLNPVFGPAAGEVTSGYRAQSWWSSGGSGE